MFVCAAVECNGGIPEEQDVALQSTADQEVPHPDVLPDQSAGDFDFNEFFNLENMPGLASVSTGVHFLCSKSCHSRGVSPTTLFVVFFFFPILQYFRESRFFKPGLHIYLLFAACGSLL